MLHFYTHIQCLETDRGTSFQLRRDDGQRVVVSRKRFNELVDKGQLVSRERFNEIVDNNLRLERHESYRGRTTAQTVWRVWNKGRTHYVAFNTKREAVAYLNA